MTSSNNTDPTSRPSWRYRLLWLILAGPTFFLLYGQANEYAARMPAHLVGNVAFGWERDYIPFWPWTIVPYWSIDVMYAISIIIGTSRAEVRTQACRLLLTTGLASLCFVLWPMRFGWDRPEVAGVFGQMFTALGLFDKPFNQAPSLHIALLYVIWLRLIAHAAPRWHALIHGWCVLIGVSVLTTWQHHLLDIPTGLALGVAVCYLLPMPPRGWPRWRPADPARARTLALRYLAGALVFAAIALISSGWAWLALWPAAALAMVALGYAWLGPAVFQKTGDGHSTLAATWLLLPQRIGAWISFQCYRRRITACSRVAADVALGCWPDQASLQGCTAVLDLAPELPRSRATSALAYRAVPLLDLLPPTVDELSQAVAALEDLRRHGPVLVHCALGLSRSAAVLAAWLVAHGGEPDIEHAMQRVRQAHPGVVLQAGHQAALLNWSIACR
ncbi:MAG TPA: phosphatase PAP2/dual specificity phosphatase family protein [Chitinolyticbacter sp.]|nr:phosphatase PAP2/dual specificity phosphatase family protein [Chitinolyticbacter sp.]